MACFRPSNLQSCVVKHLQQVLNRIGDNQADYLPETVRSEELSKLPLPECLWKLNKKNIHIFDGDGGEISLWMQIGLKQLLLKLLSHLIYVWGSQVAVIIVPCWLSMNKVFTYYIQLDLFVSLISIYFSFLHWRSSHPTGITTSHFAENAFPY